MEKWRWRGKSDLLEGTQQVIGKSEMKTQGFLAAQPDLLVSHKN